MRWRIRALQPKDVAHRQHMIDSLQVYVSMLSGPLVGNCGDTLGQVRPYTISAPDKLCGTTTHGEKPMMLAVFHPHDHEITPVRTCVSRAHYLQRLWLIIVSCSTGIPSHLDTTLCVTHPSTPRISWTNCGSSSGAPAQPGPEIPSQIWPGPPRAGPALPGWIKPGPEFPENRKASQNGRFPKQNQSKMPTLASWRVVGHSELQGCFFEGALVRRQPAWLHCS